ncbi:adenosylcobinamide-phosphate synthase CbiB [Chitinophaga vietnamensis]|uniref:adenosylcobinamide-phosphate synthase CbiB n=1 Tax=Chitinophaga vietnamensis TaxID=2593957 RepID=UPI001F003314|nr:adenosylcobinamide-phosphate synthase CbiB [Chitinophaga vietnamensis]
MGYAADLLLGDPRGWPHPVKLFGRLISTGTRWLNRGGGRLFKGALLTLLLCAGTFFIFWWIGRCLERWPLAWYAFTSLFVFFALANKSLLQEGREVFDTLHTQGLEAGRQRLSWIVGRDTSQLSAQQVRIAVMESMSENLSDGVIAPLCFYAAGGLPAMMLYKMINTLDSMIGYKRDPYCYFGRAAARLDDVANFIPARLTAILMVIVSGNARAWRFIRRYGRAHASPNAGYPEAAMAGILNTRFGGPNTYHGVLVVKPYIGENDRTLHHKDFRKAVCINHGVTLLMIICMIVISMIFKFRFDEISKYFLSSL